MFKIIFILNIKDVPLQIEHMTPKSRGGSNRIGNLTLACEKCNQKKNTKTAEEFGFSGLREKSCKPLRAAAAMNATRNAIYSVLKATGLSLETGTGGRTKYNRSKQGYAKEHWLDAMCVGESGENFGIEKILGGRPNPVEGAPAFLSGYLTLPFLSPDVGIGEHVEGAGQKKAVIEAIIRGPDLDGLGEIGVLGTLDLAVLGGHARPQVPFANVARRVTAFPEHISHGMLVSREAQTDEPPWSALFALAEPEGVAPRHDGGPTGHADRVGDVSVGELHAILAEAVEVWSRHFGFLATKGLDVSIAQVVGEDEDDVRPFGGRQKDARTKKGYDGRKVFLHGRSYFLIGWMPLT